MAVQNSDRPTSFSEFVGQKNACKQIEVALKSARMRSDVVDHILLSGPSGLGKTTIAQLIAKEQSTRCFEINSTIIKKPADIVSTLCNLKRGDVFFIDEIHSLPTSVQEYLYVAMEDYRVSVIGTTRSVNIPLNKFTLVGATTQEGELAKPFLTRFGVQCRLESYSDGDIADIVTRAAIRNGVKIAIDAVNMIASRSRATPRIAIRYLHRVYDYAIVSGSQIISAAIAHTTFATLGVFEHGLTAEDYRVMKALAGGGAIGIDQLSSITNIDKHTLEFLVEPHLLRKGIVTRMPRGRILTPYGYELLQTIKW